LKSKRSQERERERERERESTYILTKLKESSRIGNVSEREDKRKPMEWVEKVRITLPTVYSFTCPPIPKSSRSSFPLSPLLLQASAFSPPTLSL
jgi:hypothetical protein